MKESLKVKLSLAFGCMIVVVIAILGISMYTYNVFVDEFGNYSNSYYEINSFRTKFNEFNDYFKDYLNSGDENSFEKCQECSQDLKSLCNTLNSKYNDNSLPTQKSLMEALTSSYNSYIEQAQTLIDMKDTSQALELYNSKYSKNAEYINDYTERLLNFRFQIGSEYFQTTQHKINIFKVINIVTFIILGIIIFILMRMLFKNVVKPIEQLSQQSQQISNYNFDVPNINIDTKDEVASLVKMFNHMREKLKLMFESNMKSLQMAEEVLAKVQNNESLKDYINKQKNLNEELFRDVNIDHLTNLMNMNAFVHCVDENLEGLNNHELCGLFLLDIDNFMNISNVLKGEGSDQLLKYTAVEMDKIFKDFGFIARCKQDTFVAFISNMPNEQFAHQKCKELNEAMRIRFKYQKRYQTVTVSIGVSLAYKDTLINANSMYEKAHQCVDNVKQSGKNGYHIEKM